MLDKAIVDDVDWRNKGHYALALCLTGDNHLEYLSMDGYADDRDWTIASGQYARGRLDQADCRMKTVYQDYGFWSTVEPVRAEESILVSVG